MKLCPRSSVSFIRTNYMIWYNSNYKIKYFHKKAFICEMKYLIIVYMQLKPVS